jgi:hypothetical protein
MRSPPRRSRIHIVELSREIELDMGGRLAASDRVAGARRAA